jgi:glycosyltransferase involved in cell wall biosynthesis
VYKDLLKIVVKNNMKKENQPLVSIGLLVFNGQNGLACALDSLLGQDYPNLEIVISDNASTDATPDICKKYVQKDSRIKYSRSEKNLGAIWNSNRVFELSSGKYFMWASDDDQREPSFVSSCVGKMEQCPEAVLCHSHTAVSVVGQKEMMYVSTLDGFEGVAGLVEQYRETLKHFPTTAIYGLYRSSAMRKTRLCEKVMATDISFIQELSLHGTFVQVPRVLFNYCAREKWNTVDQDYQFFFGKDKKPWWYLPFVVLFCNHWSRVASASVPFRFKLRLWRVLLEHQMGQVALKMLIKVSGRVCPSAWKERLAHLIYERWMRGPNLQIDCEDVFLERVIKPRFAWFK